MPQLPPGARSSQDGENRAGGRADDRVDAVAALSALNDDRCRQILVATEDEPLTAREIAETCDLPSSTAYRKLDLLTEASLLEEHLRPRSDGNHVSEYASRSLSMTFGLSAEGVEVSLSSAHEHGPTRGAD